MFKVGYAITELQFFFLVELSFGVCRFISVVLNN